MSISRADRQQISERAGHRCEYCRLHSLLQGANFHVDHIQPTSRGGDDDYENLALMCASCNLSKSDRETLTDPETGDLVPIFHPRQHQWAEHFQFEGFRLVGRIAIGRTIVDALRLNKDKLQFIRAAEQEFGLFPPSGND